MNTRLNKEKLTAYVLGELEPDERAAMEQALRSDEQARREVEEIRAAAALMQKAFDPESEISLTDEQRETIRRLAEEGGEADSMREAATDATEKPEERSTVVSLETGRRRRRDSSS